MAKVNILDEHTSNLIAAGEVVIDPKSVIKELIENSLDANSNNIKIEIDEAGYRQIIIDDDGMGMGFEDACNAIKRHATSKIANKEDLNSINTLGFRGEALPSIASVSSFKLETTDKNSFAFIQVQGGKILKTEKINTRNIGTKITIENLFYNTPARLKHQVSTKYQFSQIKEYVYQMSLIRSDVKFTLIHNGVLILNSFENDEIANVSQIYGLEVAKNLNTFTYEDMDFKINGFYIDPKYAKSNKKSMLFSINKRLIWSNNLANSVCEALGKYLMVKKYPICYFDIEIDTSLIDVNVHPQKRLVKISKEDKLCQLLTSKISQHYEQNFKLFTIDEDSVIAANNLEQEISIKKIPTEDYKQKPILEISKELNTNSNPTFNPDFYDSYDSLQFTDVEKQKPEDKQESNIRIRNDMPSFIYIGQYLNSYLIAQSENDLILIDQHAAMERINYERYLNELLRKEKYNISLAVPISINVSLFEMEVLLQKQAVLKALALEFEPFGNNTVLIRSVPSFINTHKVQKFIELIFESIFNNRNITKEKLIDELAIIKACKLSIKANQQLDNYEANKLIDQLYYVKNYASCPHGRPITIKITTKQIEKLFKRIV